MTTSLYLAGFLFIIGSALLAIIKHFKEWIDNKIDNKKILKRVKILGNGISILIIVLGAYIAVNDLIERKDNAQYDGIFVSPEEIVVPIKAGRSMPIIVTNNYQFPVYMVGLEFTVIEGDISLEFMKNFVVESPVGFGGIINGSKSFSCYIPAILAKSSVPCLVTIDCNNCEKETRIEVFASYYSMKPVTDFWKDGQNKFPESIKFPSGFEMEIIKIEKKKK